MRARTAMAGVAWGLLVILFLAGPPTLAQAYSVRDDPDCRDGADPGAKAPWCFRICHDAPVWFGLWRVQDCYWDDHHEGAAREGATDTGAGPPA